jgi:hypothetical protein
MKQLFIILSYAAWIFSLIGLGCYISEFIKMYFEDFEITDEFKVLYYGILGLIAVSVIGTVFNFFIPLGAIFSTSTMVVGIILFFVYQKNISQSYSRINILIVAILFVYGGLLTLTDLKNYDTLLYHLPMIDWTSNFSLPFGLANLNNRLGFNSSWFVAASIIYPLRIITKSPVFIINAIFFFFYGTFVLFTLKRMMKRNEAQLSSIFVLTTFIPWFYCLVNFISSPSPDVPAMLLTLVVTFLLIKTFETENADYLFILLIISFYIVTIKLSAAPYFIGILLMLSLFFVFRKLLRKKDRLISKNLKNIKYIFTALMLSITGIPYLIRGFISSGYVAFPLPFGRLDFKWSVPVSDAVNAENWVKNWARKPGANPDEILNNWNWLSAWTHQIISDNVLVSTAILGLVLIIICFIFKKKKNLFIFMLIAVFSFMGCLFWFFAAPDIRFGYGYIYSFLGILISYGIYNIFDKKEAIAVFLKVICFLILLAFFYQNNINFKEIYDINNIKSIKFIERKTKDQVTIYVPTEIDQCFDGPLTLSPPIYKPSKTGKCFDGPLMSTLYFNENLKIVFDKNNNPIIFWVEK